MRRFSPLHVASLALLISGAAVYAQDLFGEAEYTITVAASTDPCEEGPIGTVCADGAVYVGDTVAGARMFMAPANEPGTYRLKEFDTVTNGVNTSDGLLNTVIMASDAAAHPAARACLARGAGWYLPSREELEAIRSNAFLSPSFGSVWASGRQGDLTGNVVSSSSSTSSFGRTNLLNVRCVRVGSQGAPETVTSLSIPSVPSALPDTIVTSAAAYPRLLRTTTPVPVSVSGDGDPVISVAGGAFAASGTIRAGETVAVRLRSATEVGVTRTVNLQIAGQSFPFSVTTRADCSTGPIGSLCADGTVYAADDANGERIYLATQDEPGTHQWKTSNTASTPGSDVSGYRTTLSLLSSTASALVHPAASVCAKRGPGWFLPSKSDADRIAANKGLLPVEANLTSTQYWGADQFDASQARQVRFDAVLNFASSKSGARSVRCARLDPVSTPLPPNAFTVSAVTLAERDVLVSSASVFVHGMRSLTPSVITVSGEGDPEVSVAGGPFGTTGTILDGQSFVVRLRSAPGFAETRTATVTIGGVSSDFAVTTAADCETGPVGTQCSDGAVYAGTTRDGSVRFYVSPTSTLLRAWKTVTTSTPGTTSLTDGYANTTAMMAEPSVHLAGAYCAGLGHGWFLPSEQEVVTMGANLSSVPAANLIADVYMTSTELNATQYRVVSLFSGNLLSFGKASITNYLLRCARLGDSGDPGVATLSFPSLNSVAVDTIAASSQSQIVGLKTRAPVQASVSGDGSPQFSVNGGPFVTSGQVRIGDRISVRLRSASDLGVTRTATMTVGAASATFSVTTGSCENDPVGSICADGAIYAGMSGSNRMYVSPTDEPLAMRWKTEPTSTIGATSASDGFLNTAIMMAEPGLHPAASACRARGANWYLPSSAELAVLANNAGALTASGIAFSADIYWSSTETGGATANRRQIIGATSGNGTKTNNNPVRCVRTGPDALSAVPDPLAFVAVTRPFDTVVTSAPAIFSGPKDLTPRPISVFGDGEPEISINGGAFATSGTVTLGQRVVVRLRSAPEEGSVRTVTITAGGVQSTFSVTSGPSCQTGPVGTICADGAIYAGNNALGARMYVAPSDEGSLAIKTENTRTIGSDGALGFSNTAVMVTDAVSHPAALACRARGPEWYLPSDTEMRVLNTNRNLLNAGFGTSFYWTSTEDVTNPTRQVQLQFGGTLGTSWNKNSAQAVRCVRAEPTGDIGTYAMTFIQKNSVPASAIVTSDPTPLTGLIILPEERIPVSVTGDGNPEISVNGGPFGTSGEMRLGDRIVVRMTAAASEWGSQNATVTFGTQSAVFTSLTAGLCTSTLAPIGAVCADGAIYAGNSGGRIYVAAADETATEWLRSPNAIFSPFPSASSTNGLTNQTNLRSKSTIDFPAVNRCHNKGASPSRWYLPSTTEFQVLFQNRASIPGLFTSSTRYWTSNATFSTVNFSTAAAASSVSVSFSGALQFSTSLPASSSYGIRCIRR